MSFNMYDAIHKVERRRSRCYIELNITDRVFLIQYHF